MKSTKPVSKFAQTASSLSVCAIACSSLGAFISLAFTDTAQATVKVAYPESERTPEGGKGEKIRTSGSGTLELVDATGKNLGQAVLKHTSFQANVAGYVNRVKVEQTFSNPYDQAVEAIYTFPLSDTGAVDQMVMKVGDRTINGVIKKREEARQTYEQARRQGRTASLLDQERHNIFTQSVANIPPKGTVKIEIYYVEYLTFESGNYSLALPMVVAPRYMPGADTGTASGTGWSNDTTQVPDASKISTPIMPENTRAGHDVSVEVNLDAGLPIQSIDSKLHKIDIKKSGDRIATVNLRPSDSIPNRDFVLTWKVATNQLQSGCLTHKTDKTGYVSVMIVPPERPKVEQIAPRELNFIVDRSGSQHGLPLQKAKETMIYILDRLNPNDTFQIISFSNETEKCFDKPVPVTPRNISDAKHYIAEMEANGGTEMRAAVEEATREPAPEHRLRIFVPMTDGLLGNDKEIIGMVKKSRGVSRWFTFGTGNGVNRFLIDGMAKAGGGEPDYVLLNSNGEEVAKKFFDKISTPILTDVKVKFDGAEVSDVQPETLNDVWAQRPLYILGKYKHAGTGTVTITGFSAGKPYTNKLTVNLPELEPKNDVLPSVWARTKVEGLTEIINAESPNSQFQNRDSLPKLVLQAREEIEGLGLEYHILTDYTSFVAVDEQGDKQKPSDMQVVVPGEAPDGMSLSKVFANNPRGASTHPTVGHPMQVGAGTAVRGVHPGRPQVFNNLQGSAPAPEAAKGLSPALGGAFLSVDPSIKADTRSKSMVPPPPPASPIAAAQYQMTQRSPGKGRFSYAHNAYGGGYNAGNMYLVARRKIEASLLDQILLSKDSDESIVELTVTLENTNKETIEQLKNSVKFEVVKVDQSSKKIRIKIAINQVLNLAKQFLVEQVAKK